MVKKIFSIFFLSCFSFLVCFRAIAQTTDPSTLRQYLDRLSSRERADSILSQCDSQEVSRLVQQIRGSISNLNEISDLIISFCLKDFFVKNNLLSIELSQDSNIKIIVDYIIEEAKSNPELAKELILSLLIYFDYRDRLKSYIAGDNLPQNNQQWMGANPAQNNQQWMGTNPAQNNQQWTGGNTQGMGGFGGFSLESFQGLATMFCSLKIDFLAGICGESPQSSKSSQSNQISSISQRDKEILKELFNNPNFNEFLSNLSPLLVPSNVSQVYQQVSQNSLRQNMSSMSSNPMTNESEVVQNVAKLMNSGNFALIPVIVDVPNSADKTIRYSVTGSTKDGEFKPEVCHGANCAHAELKIHQELLGKITQNTNLNPQLTKVLDQMKQYDGLAFMAIQQKVLGGTGSFVGEEPTGHKSWSSDDLRKLVLMKIDEKNGLLYFGTCYQMEIKDKKGRVLGRTPHRYCRSGIDIPIMPKHNGVLREGEILLIGATVAKNENFGQNTGSNQANSSQSSQNTPRNATSNNNNNNQNQNSTSSQQGQQGQQGQSQNNRPLNFNGRICNPMRGSLTSKFGWRIHPITGQRRFHNGIDIGAPEGEPVRAAADGIVVFAGWLGGYGNTVIINHTTNRERVGTETLYAHLSKINVPKGQRVSQGQVIGLNGNTGFSRGPHLHFEVRENDQPRDPLPILQRSGC